jgi:hypothetical protein
VRGTEILLVVLALLGSSLGCTSKAPVSEREARPESGAEARPESGTASGPESKPAANLDEPKPGPDDPERPSKLADLDDLCKALDHDYVDGTLSDYYRGIEPRTAWGKAQRDAGNESVQPGRLLEKAVTELSPGAEDPALEHCRKLLDYLDDVE